MLIGCRLSEPLWCHNKTDGVGGLPVLHLLLGNVDDLPRCNLCVICGDGRL